MRDDITNEMMTSQNNDGYLNVTGVIYVPLKIEMYKHYTIYIDTQCSLNHSMHG